MKKKKKNRPKPLNDNRVSNTSSEPLSKQCLFYLLLRKTVYGQCYV